MNALEWDCTPISLAYAIPLILIGRIPSLPRPILSVSDMPRPNSISTTQISVFRGLSTEDLLATERYHDVLAVQAGCWNIIST